MTHTIPPSDSDHVHPPWVVSWAEKDTRKVGWGETSLSDAIIIPPHPQVRAHRPWSMAHGVAKAIWPCGHMQVRFCHPHPSPITRADPRIGRLSSAQGEKCLRLWDFGNARSHVPYECIESCCVSRPPTHRPTKSPNHQITKSPDHQIEHRLCFPRRTCPFAPFARSPLSPLLEPIDRASSVDPARIAPIRVNINININGRRLGHWRIRDAATCSAIT
jgi:hypothetical protein